MAMSFFSVVLYFSSPAGREKIQIRSILYILAQH